jgi:hypothetical protein
MNNITALILFASLEFQYADPYLVKNTSILLQESISNTLNHPQQHIHLDSYYYIQNKIVNKYPPLLLQNPVPTPDSSVCVFYTIHEPTSTILQMNLLEFNTLMAKSSYTLNYSKLVGGSDYIIAAGPIELLHLPSPRPYTPTQSSSSQQPLIINIFKYLILYIFMMAGHIENNN